ncbi:MULTISPECIES: HEAT repeat domain-containing protein [unclassified Paenibacillus]|uniref:HEAT repeat domain-containing protein n=1 Tax=unclassified Paenibacillus TaxID=185978 RepID=UPI003834D642
MNKLLLENVINNGDLVVAVKMIEEVGEKRDNEFTAILIKHLGSTDSPILRNAIAIALADIRNQEAILPLINVLKDPKTEGSRGTLLYALESFDIVPHVITITDLLDDNFEVSRHSFQLISGVANNLSSIQKEICKQLIKDKIADVKNENNRTFLLDSLRLFN